MSLSHFSLFVFVKQLKKKFKTKTGLSFQVFLKVSKKGEGRCHCLNGFPSECSRSWFLKGWCNHSASPRWQKQIFVRKNRVILVEILTLIFPTTDPSPAFHTILLQTFVPSKRQIFRVPSAHYLLIKLLPDVFTPVLNPLIDLYLDLFTAM